MIRFSESPTTSEAAAYADSRSKSARTSFPTMPPVVSRIRPVAVKETGPSCLVFRHARFAYEPPSGLKN